MQESALDNKNQTGLIGWDIINEQWFSAHEGDLDGIVYATKVDGNILYVGGNFSVSSLATSQIIAQNLYSVQLNNKVAQRIPATCYSTQECADQIIYSIALFPSKILYEHPNASSIYIAGRFTTIDDIIVNNVARLYDERWISLDTGITSSNLEFVFSLALSPGTFHISIFFGFPAF